MAISVATKSSQACANGFERCISVKPIHSTMHDKILARY